MINSLDHLIIAVENLEEAEQNYTKIFGTPPAWKGEHKELGTANVLFNFKNTYFELLAIKGEGLGAALVNHYLEESGEGLIGMVLGTDDMNKVTSSLHEKGFNITEPSDGEGVNFKNKQIRKWKNLFLPPELTRGLFSFVIQHTEGELPLPERFKSSSINKLDHVVINTNDADGFIDIYKNVFKIRLALDKTIDAWKSRMLFFRFNKTTIEVIEKPDDKDSSDKLWGLAWEVENIEETCSRLLSEGVDVTPVKNGIKENTLVVTVKSHTHNVPTLLIEHVK